MSEHRSQMPARVHIKICCISSIAEAALALEHGAGYLGLVSAMPSGPGVIADDAIDRIREWIGDQAKTVLLTSRTSAVGVLEQIERHHPHVVQLCDGMSLRELQVLRDRIPDTVLMPVVHVRDASSVPEAIALASHADALLLDSGNPAAVTRELGGTGRVHDWKLSRIIRDSIDVPLFLAGGLRAQNVRAAIEAVRPAGVDVCSGVREGGALDPARLESFVQQARVV